MALVEALPLLDTLKHGTGWLETGQWSKMTWASVAMRDSAAGASAESFGTSSGSFFNPEQYKTHDAISLVTNNSSPIAERFVSLWLCYNNTTHSGYRAVFAYTSATEMKVKIFSVSSGTETLLGESAVFVTEAGMTLGLEKTSTTVEAYVKKGVTWTKLLSVTNSTFTEGFLGIDGQGSNPTFTEIKAKTEGATAPTLTNPGTKTGTVGVPITPFTPTATHTLTFHVTGLPSGLTLNEVTGEITGTPTTHESPTVALTAVGQGGEVTQSFTWNITLAAPTISNPGTQNSQASLGILRSTLCTVTNTTSITTTGLPPGLNEEYLFGTSWIVSGTPTLPGTYSVTVTAHGEGGETSTTFTWVIISMVVLMQVWRTIEEQFPLHLMIGGEDCTFLLAESFTFANADPGGYESASFPLPRDLPWVERGMKVLLTTGTYVAWEGRVKEIQRSLGNKTLIQCEGYSAILKEQTIREIFVARDLKEWAGPTVGEQIEALATGHTPTGPNIVASPAGTPALAQEAVGAWEANAAPGPLAFYDPHSIPLGSLFYEWESGEKVNTADVNWNWHAAMFVTIEPPTGEQSTGNLRVEGVSKGSGTLTASTNTRVYIALPFSYAKVAAGGAGVRYIIYWKNLAVYGRHGLTKRGTEPGGFYTSDIVTFVGKQAIGLQIGYIPVNSNFIVPHSVYLTYVPLEQVITDMAKFVSCHWGVWESPSGIMGGLPRLDFRPYPRKPTAYVFRSSCETLDIREDLTNQYNVAQVSYVEAAGIERTVEASVPNPALIAAGITRRVITLNMGTATAASALAYGQLVLEILQIQARVTGQATIKEFVYKVDGQPMPAWLLKAGIDRLRVPDMPCSDVWGEHNDLPITRMEATGGEDGVTVSVEFGAGRNLMEALTAQLEAATQIAAAS